MTDPPSSLGQPTLRNDLRLSDLRRGPPLEGTRYRDLVEIAHGGMGVIFRATDPFAGRDVAIKTMIDPASAAPDQLAKFLHEGRITAQLEHPGIMPVHEVGTDAAGRPYLVMKLVGGSTLADLLLEYSSTRTAPLDRLLAIYERVCDAVAFAHARGVIHRDLKPANVMVGEFGEVLVCDWGLAKRVGEVDADVGGGATPIEQPMGRIPGTDRAGGPFTTSSRHTRDGTVLGTPAYMPPEQAEGRLVEIDERSDVYALGAILYELLTGTPPHRGTSGLDVLMSAAEGAVDAPSVRSPGRAIPRELEAICLTALARERSYRYPSAQALGADLRAYLEGRRVRVARYGPAQLLVVWLRRHRTLAGMLGVASLAALAVGGHAAWSRRIAERARARDLDLVRTELAALDPRTTIARARAAIDRASRADAFASERGAAVDAELGRLSRIAELAARAHAIDDTVSARELRTAALTAIAELAAAHAEFALAQLALSELASCAPNPAIVARARTSCTAARDRHDGALTRTIDRRLAQARKGELGRPEHMAEATYDLARDRTDAARVRLTTELDAISRAMLALVRTALLGTAAPTADERRAGEGEIADLAPALDAWTACCERPGEAAPLSVQEREAVGRARARLMARTPGHRSRVAWSTHAAGVASAALPPGDGGAQLVALLARSLGQLGDNVDTPAALARYLWADADSIRTRPAGEALAALVVRSATARARLLELIGVAPSNVGEAQWHFDSPWWQSVSAAVPHDAPLDVAVGSDAATSDALLAQALALFELGRHREALPLLDRAVQLAPDVARAWRDRGVARYVLNDVDGALADFDRAVALEPWSAKALNGRGAARERKHDLAGAIADYEASLGVDPRQPTARTNLVMLLLRAARPDDAAPHVAILLRDAPDAAQTYHAQACVAHTRGDVALALAAHDRSIALEPMVPEYRVARGETRELGGDVDGAVLDYTAAIALDAGSAAAHDARGWAYLTRGDARRALVDLQRAVELDPTRARTHARLGHARTRNGDPRGALVELARALELDPRLGLAYLFRGIARAALGDAAATTDFDTARELEPRSYWVRMHRGQHLHATGDARGALADIEVALELKPGSADAKALSAQLLAELGRSTEALARYDVAIEAEPRNAEFRVNRGCVRWKSGDAAGALADFDAAIALDPRLAMAYLNRGRIHLDARRLAPAIEDYDRVIELTPESALGFAMRGEARLLTGDVERAFRDLTRAAELAPSRWQTWANLGIAQGKLGRVADARAAYTRALGLAPEAQRPAIQRDLDALPR